MVIWFIHPYELTGDRTRTLTGCMLRLTLSDTLHGQVGHGLIKGRYRELNPTRWLV